MIFYLTFGQKNTALRNGWIEVEAEDYFGAVEIARDAFGNDWANLYSELDFNTEHADDETPLMKHFKLGKIGETLK